jgi:hypothetical protein
VSVLSSLLFARGGLLQFLDDFGKAVRRFGGSWHRWRWGFHRPSAFDVFRWRFLAHGFSFRCPSPGLISDEIVPKVCSRLEREEFDREDIFVSFRLRTLRRCFCGAYESAIHDSTLERGTGECSTDVTLMLEDSDRGSVLAIGGRDVCSCSGDPFQPSCSVGGSVVVHKLDVAGL